jgi:hypothetical protein
VSPIRHHSAFDELCALVESKGHRCELHVGELVEPDKIRREIVELRVTEGKTRRLVAGVASSLRTLEADSLRMLGRRR